MDFNRREALRYLRARPDDKKAQVLVDTVYLKLRNEVQARHVLQKHGVQVDAEGVTLDCGIRFTSSSTFKGLPGSIAFGGNLGQSCGRSHTAFSLGQRGRRGCGTGRGSGAD